MSELFIGFYILSVTLILYNILYSSSYNPQISVTITCGILPTGVVTMAIELFVT